MVIPDIGEGCCDYPLLLDLALIDLAPTLLRCGTPLIRHGGIWPGWVVHGSCSAPIEL